jgi:hypothetical protein
VIAAVRPVGPRAAPACRRHTSMVRSRMDDYTPSTYGDRIASIYDEWHPIASDAEQAAELDLMAELAGLRLRHRWADWNRAPFDSSSTKHGTVYELALA